MNKNLPNTIDEYIASCAYEIQPMLHELRSTIVKAAPKAEEKISWGMATFYYFGNLVHFSGEKKHIGFHPTPSVIEAFKEELTDYVCSKGTVRLPLDKPLPLELIGRMVRFRVKEQEEMEERKKAGEKTQRIQRTPYPVPDDVSNALKKEELVEQYHLRPPYQQNDYIGWITKAKRAQTREKRLKQMLEELRGGDSYMGKAYEAKK